MTTPTARPPLGWFLTEPARGLLAAATLPFATPMLRRAPRGDGHAVIVLPGLMATDASTAGLRRYLRWLGYDARGWGLGRNIGPSAVALDGMTALVTTAAAKGPVSLIGWSLGGVFARELARARPDQARQVITLAAPFALTDQRQSRVNGTYNRCAKQHAHDGRVPRYDWLRAPINTPSTAVYTAADGIVHWSSCIEPPGPTHENIAVRSGHLGIGVDPAVWWLIADRLAQPLGEWTPFVAPRSLRACYPRVRELVAS